MWIRDSTNQVLPYIPLAPQEPKLWALLFGVVNRQSTCLGRDVYANAFNLTNHGKSDWASDYTKPVMSRNVWEGKYELDSWAAFFKVHIGTSLFCIHDYTMLIVQCIC